MRLCTRSRCTRRTLTPLLARRRRLPPPRLRGAIRLNPMYRSKSSSAVSATPISTKFVTSGAASCLLCTPASRAMRSSAVSLKSAQRSRSSSPATSPRSAAWLTPTEPAPSARRALSSSAVNEAYDRLLKSDVKYRFSIDLASLNSH